jgi:hypothetical protein
MVGRFIQMNGVGGARYCLTYLSKMVIKHLATE